jgi:hypothetical protein
VGLRGSNKVSYQSDKGSDAGASRAFSPRKQNRAIIECANAIISTILFAYDNDNAALAQRTKATSLSNLSRRPRTPPNVVASAPQTRLRLQQQSNSLPNETDPEALGRLKDIENNKSNAQWREHKPRQPPDEGGQA